MAILIQIMDFIIKRTSVYLRKGTCLLLAMAMGFLFISCENDMMEVAKLTAKDSIPDVSIQKIFVQESENGHLKMELSAPLMVNYRKQDAFTEFPKGIKVMFYDSLHQPESELTALYGISWDNRNTMQARGNVVVYNYKKHQQLNTEILNWDQNIKKVYTTEAVKITDPEKTILGKGMESSELFDNWTIRNVSGTILVNEQQTPQ